MKIIHCADIHLGSKINTSLSDISKERRADLRASFMRMCEYARENDIHIILLAGDIFDSDTPFKKDKDNFYTTIRNYEDIDFLYLKGNHDLNEVYDDTPSNLKHFSDTWTKYRYDKLVISGLEMTKANALSFYDSLALNEQNINIVMLHGEISEHDGYNLINLAKLRNKQIDYLALGHIHSLKEYKLDGRGVACYSGCIEGRGFDELGPKGFIVLDITDKIKHEFIPFSAKIIHDLAIDISGSLTVNDVINKINQATSLNNNDIYRITLKGDVSPSLDLTPTDIKCYYSNIYFLRIIIDTSIIVNLDDYKSDISLKGEFVRGVLAKDNISEADKREIISLGLKVLEGGQSEGYENN